MPSLVWFRSDLRTTDNTALHHATRRPANDGCVAVFMVSPEEWKDHDVAPVRGDFILRNLASLSAALEAINIPLVILHAPRARDVPRLLLELAERTGCDCLFFNKEYEVDESARDAAVTSLFASRSLQVHAFEDQAVMAPGLLRTREGRFFTVFTPFRKRWVIHFLENGGTPVLPAPKKQAPVKARASASPSSVRGFESTIPPGPWPAGERAAHARLRSFTKEKIADYKTQRNSPALDGTSALSPYLAAGILSPRQCLAAAIASNRGRLDSGKAGPVTWITQLVWREFYIHILAGFPRVCRNRPFRLATEQIRWSDNDDHFQAWCQGRTGVPIVDAAMRCLVQTGWMHNRLRMITAMYLAKDFFIDWRRGEKFFMQNLVDGFFASNNGGWQWSASTGTDAAPYFRIFNPVSQSRTYDPDGAFIRRWCPELAALDNDAIHDPFCKSAGPALAAATALNYPRPIVDHRTARERVLRAFKSLA